MKRINLPLIGDSLFAALCAFLLFFTLIRYYTKNVALSFAIAVFAFIIFGGLVYYKINKTRHRKLLSAREEKEKDNLILHLCVAEADENAKLFATALRGEQDGETVLCGDDIYYAKFKLEPLSSDDIAGVIKNATHLQKVILCNKTSAASASFAEKYGIKIMYADDVYALLKGAELLPENTFIIKNKPSIYKTILSRLNRRRCAPLFWCGFSLLFFSFFTFFPIYYIISGSALLILSAACLLFGKRA